MDVPSIVVKLSEGRSVLRGGMGVVLKVSVADTGGAFAVVEHPIEPARLVLPHIHRHENEYSYVLEGTISTTRSVPTSMAPPPHAGRSGWTWYTGSAGWLYRVALEAILGIRPSGDLLRVEHCISGRWPGYKIAYRHGTATYRIRVENPAGAGRGLRSVLVDGQMVPGAVVPLRDDGREHDGRVTLGHEKG